MTRRELLAAALAPAGPHIQVTHAAGVKVSFHAGQRLLFEYRYAPSRPKPYVHPFCAPDGTPLTIDSPADHVHHRGLMLAWSNVAGFDFWGETNPGAHGQIIHQRFEQAPSAEGLAAINRWAAEGKPLLEERRQVRPLQPGPDFEGLEWTSALRAAGDPVTLDASKHVYNGLGIRFVRSMDLGMVLNARGTRTIEQANGEDAAWCCYYGGLKDRHTAGVAILNHPSNPRHPAPFFVMNKPFGYLAAAPTFREPFRLMRERALVLRWAVVSFLGEPSPERLAALYRKWSQP